MGLKHVAALALLLGLTGCSVPTTHDLRAFPTLDDVKTLAMEEATQNAANTDTVLEAIEEHHDNITEQHSVQTPDHIPALNDLRSDFLQRIAAVRSDMHDRVAAYREEVRQFSGVQGQLDQMEAAIATIRSNPSGEDAAAATELILSILGSTLGLGGLTAGGIAMRRAGSLAMQAAVNSGPGRAFPSDKA